MKPIPPLSDEQIARFDSYVRPQPSGCWEWGKLARGHDGRGRIKINCEDLLAPRVAWRRYNGDDPGELWVLHKCDNPPCVNPDHLWLGTPRDNMRDMAVKGRAYGQEKTHCPSGHEYTPENTYRAGFLMRKCVECSRIRRQRKQALNSHQQGERS